MSRQYHCKKVSKGQATGTVLRSEDAILFYHTNPQAGILTEHGHCLQGQCISGRMLVFPSGKGSSVVQADGLYRLDKFGTAPCGLIVEELDTVLVSCAIIMEIPMVCQVDAAFYTDVKDGDQVVLNADEETVTIV